MSRVAALDLWNLSEFLPDVRDTVKPKPVGNQRSVLEGIAAGDAAAVDQCLRQFGGLVWSLARRYLRGSSDLEDVVQEIFIELWRTAGRFDSSRATETTFVAMIARRRLVDKLRRTGSKLSVEDINEADVAIESASVDRNAVQSEDVDQARRCLDQLKSEERTVIEQTVCNGSTQSQLSKQTGLPLGTVKSHARRGLIKMRDCMRAHSFGLRGGGAE